MRVRGSRSLGRADVYVDHSSMPLSPVPSQEVLNHSPDGFEWGYRGSGPAQLALALLLHAGVGWETAVLKHQELKEQVIANLGYDFEIELDINQDGTFAKKPLL